MRRLTTSVLILPALALGACGSDEKPVNTASYSCSQFNKSLATKGDNSSGNFINQLRKEAKLGQPKATERRELALGIYLTCRGKPGSTKPAQGAIRIAKAAKSGTLRLTGAPSKDKKKSDK